MKRALLYIFIALFLISIYKDLTLGTPLNQINHQQQPNERYVTNTKNITAMRVKVQQGDTVITIVEKINNQETTTLDITQIISDFKALNPTEDPIQLKSGEFYSFPIYQREADY